MGDLRRYSGPPRDERREEVVEILTKHYGLDNLTMDEFEARVGRAHAAQTGTELELVVHDLPALPREETPERAAGSSHEAGVRINDARVENEENAVAIFSGFERKGDWYPARTIKATAIFGGGDIDLSEAALPPDGVVIDAFCFFGGLRVVVPAGVDLRIEGGGVFGGFSGKGTRGRGRTADPNALTVRIRGFAVFGGVTCEVADNDDRRRPRHRRHDR